MVYSILSVLQYHATEDEDDMYSVVLYCSKYSTVQYHRARNDTYSYCIYLSAILQKMRMICCLVVWLFVVCTLQKMKMICVVWLVVVCV
jgi:hypothetical protein